MLKASMRSKDGKRVLLLGLSHGNLDRLRQDGTNGFIPVEGEEFGLPDVKIIITAGETEQSMAHDLREFIGGCSPYCFQFRVDLQVIDAKLSRREAVVGAIIDLHLRRLLESFPSHKSARAQVETYRPYAEQEADAVLAALDNLKSE